MENISAISTARGTGGVSIIRISGDSPLEIAREMFAPLQNGRVVTPIPNMMYPGYIHCETFDDYGMFVYFKGPRSFTGEDIVEFHCHGGELIADGVLKKTFSLGARPAEAGEFTKRAFLNGKLTLSSAEGMIDMINATSEASLRAAGMLYRDKTIKAVTMAQDELKQILASIDADMDYPEEDVLATEIGSLGEKLSPILSELEKLVSTYPRGRMIRSGVNVALCGRPNVGKSSLLNVLLGYDKAIVSSEAGTTRDAVEGTTEIDGILFKFTDTAGLRAHAGEIESKGIEIAKNVISSADIVVYVSDETETDDDEPECCAERLLRVFNKSDIRSPSGKYDCVVSTVTREGIEELRRLLLSHVPTVRGDDEAVICEERHVIALRRACDSLRQALAAVDEYTADMVALDITDAWQALGEITGETANENIIDEVFSGFCVGK